MSAWLRTTASIFWGDFTYRLPLAEAVRLRERIECQNVTLIRGNHDGDWEDSDVPQIWENVRDYLEIAPGYAKGHRLVMSHYPMLSWNGKARGADYAAWAYPQQG